jgi:hypothetical protein
VSGWFEEIEPGGTYEDVPKLTDPNNEGSPSLQEPEPSGPVDARPRLLAKIVRRRDKDHLKFVAKQPCLVCGRLPADPHHLRFAQPRALGRKTSDEFTVPLCRLHHRELHRRGDEKAWWRDLGVDPVPVALGLWRQSNESPSHAIRQVDEQGEISARGAE